MYPEPQALIPHRPPVLCIDTVTRVTDSTAATLRTVPRSGAFRNKLWEPWIIEGLAQTAAVLHGYEESPTGSAQAGMLVGIRQFKVHTLPAPGETLRFEVEVIKRIAPLTLIQGTALVGDTVIAEGQLKFFVEGQQ